MRVSRWLMIALFVVSAVFVVEAQQPRTGGGFGQINTNNAVLNNKDLQEELKITDAQKEKFKGVSDKQTEATKKRGEAFKDAAGDKDKLKELFADMQKDNEKLNEEIKKVVEDTLNADQKKRLAQIDLQVKGIRAFTDEKIAKDMSMTESQTSKVKSIMEEYAKDSKELGGGKGGGKGFDKEKAAENQKKREKLNKAAMADIEDALTPDQKAKWKEMVGAPFDTSKLRQGFGGFGTKNKTKD